jgi:TonB-linked SusC/RagA family outer membrane protein
MPGAASGQASGQTQKPGQQTRPVTGRVTDSTGASLGGVSVGLRGSKHGATTDSTGYFSLNVPANGSVTLTFSIIGYQDQQVALNGRSHIEVSLKGGQKDLGEVVVIGYGTRKKVNLTGAVSDISGSEIAKSPVANISNALAGSMPGLIVNTRSGEPGADDAAFFIRGVGTLGNTAPLIVIDGIPDRQGGFNRLDPNDIETFTVLKDATGAIYGARAANGVVLVTTRRGISGRQQLAFNANASITQPTRVPKMLSSHDYAQSVNEYDVLVGQLPTYTADQLQKYQDGSDPLAYPNTDWWKTVMRPWAFQTNDVMSLRGGTDKMKYYLSGQYLRQNSMYRGGSDFYTNKNARANVDIQATPTLRIGLDAVYRNEFRLTEGPQYGSAGDIFNELWSAYPYLTPRYPNGLVGVGIGGGPQNSMVYILNGQLGNSTYSYDFLQTKTTLSWDLDRITKGLHLDAYYAYDLFFYGYKGFNAQPPPAYSYNQTTKTYTQVSSTLPPNLNDSTARTEDQLFNVRLGWQRKFGKSSLEAFVAYEMSKETYTGLDAFKTGFLSNNVQELFAGSTIGATNNSGTLQTARQNYIGRISYNYDDRYLLDFNMREDGSPNFPVGKRYGFFPAVSGAWRVSNEAFFKSNTIDELKVRGSWGKTGNDAVPPYQYIQTYQLQAGQISQYLAAGYFYGANPAQVPGFVLGPTPNVNITWETATTTDLGLDMRLFKNLTFGMDVFRSKRTHILVPPDEIVPLYTGLSLPDENLGEVLNRGIEFQLGWRKTVNKDFSYFINGNFTYAVNKVLFEAEPASVPAYQRMTGHPIGSFLLYQAQGLYPDTATVNKTPHPLGSGAGDIRYKDVNGDGQINALDKVRTNQSSTPQIMYGLSLGGRYKGFDATVFLQGQASAQALLQPGGLNMAQQFYDGRWLKPGDSKYPRTFNGPTNATYGSNTYQSTFWMLNDGFLRLKNVEIGYTFGHNGLLQKAKISSARIYVSGNNLLSFDKWGPSFDPESPATTTPGQVSGTTGRYYPQQRVLNLGLSVNF